ncbi:MAG TPA: hypothetical protein VMN35_00350 [Gaiellaceae bacterium]|nr:hypothetical protein [Gaiellaceae bacterium]
MARIGLVALAATGALALGAVAAWLLVLRVTAEPASVAGAVTSFREETETMQNGESFVPEGVYVYVTQGRERTDALTGVTHPYPARTTVTVTRHECGVRMRWDGLEGRSTQWVFCVTPAGWTLESQDERHTFFGRTERTTYTCSNALVRPADDSVGPVSSVACSTGAAEELGETHVVGLGLISVGGIRVETVHLRRTSSFEGVIRGAARHDLWLARETGVPVRIVMTSRTTNDSPVGDVHYEEDVSLQLTSLTPRR